MIKQLRQFLDKFEQDSETDVAILAGLGGNFCAGYDLNEVVDRSSGRPILENIKAGLLPLGARLSDKKITIAAIEGHAAGLGYELALRCHFRVAERDSRMGFMNRRFGFPILNGGSVILPQLIGHSRAMDLIATGRAQLAPEALDFGLITHIADIGCSIGRATSLARCLSKFYQPALVHDLSSVFRSHDDKILEKLQQERISSLAYLETCQPLESAVSFLEGKLGRNGIFDMGNSLEPNPEVTL